MLFTLQLVSRRLARILGSSTPWIFLLSAVALGLLTNGLSTWITESMEDGQVGGAVTAVIGALLLILFVLFFNLPRRLREWVNRILNPRPVLTITELVSPRRGLVALVSPGPVGSPQTRQAIAYYQEMPDARTRLRHCWLIAGPGEGEDSSLDNAEKLKVAFELQGLQLHVVPLSSSEDPKEVFDVVRSIYKAASDNYQIPSEEIIADFTAGTKLMTTGMALACSAHGWAMQFMRPDRYDSQGRATKDAKSAPVIVNIDFLSQASREIAQ